MAEYGIVAVKFNSANTHVDKFRCRPIDAGNLGNQIDLTRVDVVSSIKNKNTFVTITQGSNGKWVRGAPVEIFPVTTEFLKTVKDNSLKDNLDNLPSF